MGEPHGDGASAPPAERRELGEALRALREAAGYTEEGLAAELSDQPGSVSAERVRAVEAGSELRWQAFYEAYLSALGAGDDERVRVGALLARCRPGAAGPDQDPGPDPGPDPDPDRGQPEQQPARALRERLSTLTVALRPVLVPVVVLLVVLGAVLGVGSAIADRPADPPLVAPPPDRVRPMPTDRCAPGILRRGAGECVGITDGGYAFAPFLGLTDVLGQVKAENDAVYAAGRPTVSLAYVAALPARPEGDAAGDAEIVRAELEGALTAQRRANDPEGGLPSSPAIRLLVVNIGQDGALWPELEPRLVEETARPDRLVGVLGLGPDRPSVRALVDRLGIDRIPVFPTRITDDTLRVRADQSQISGVFRSVPTIVDQAAVAAARLGRTARRVVVVSDRSAADPYATALAGAFGRSLVATPSVAVLPPESFDSSLPGTASVFTPIVTSLCNRDPRPDAVYFAGRGEDLASFLLALGERPPSCRQTRIAVMTGDGGVAVASSVRRERRAGLADLSAALTTNISLQYTALAHPAEWDRRPDLFSPPAIDPLRRVDCAFCLLAHFPGENLDDGSAIVGHDAALVAASCVRRIPQQSDVYAYPTGYLAQFCYQVGPAAPVDAGVGSVAFGPDGDALHQTVPVVEVEPDGAVTLLDTVTTS